MGGKERGMDIRISKIDERILVEADGKALPEVFSGYEIKSSDSGESELLLSIKGQINVSELSAKITR